MQQSASHSSIYAIQGFVPEQMWSTADIEKAIGVNSLESKTGIRNRYRYDADAPLSKLGAQACEDLFQKAGIRRDQIGLLIFAGITRECSEPSTACLIQDALNIRSAFSFDLGNACHGFLDALSVADAMIGSGTAKYVLIVTTERPTTMIANTIETIKKCEQPSEVKKYLTALTLGDGSAAAIVGPRQSGTLKLVDRQVQTFAEHSGLCILKDQYSAMTTDSESMGKVFLAHMPQMFARFMQNLGWSTEQITAIIPHQTSVKMVLSLCALAQIPVEKIALTVDQCGNMASAAIPYTWAKHLDERQAQPGDKFILVGAGSGLTLSLFAYEMI